MRQGNPFGDRPAWRDWLAAIAIAGILIAIAVIALSALARHGDLSNLFLKEGGEPPAVAVVQPMAATPIRAGGTGATPAAAGATRAWICERNGVREYSDRPCARDAAPTVIAADRLGPYSAPPAAAQPPAPPATIEPPTPAPRSLGLAGSTGGAAGPELRRNESVCRALEERIEAIDARMRAGYGSPEGEHLRRQHRDAKTAYHDAGCTWSRG